MRTESRRVAPWAMRQVEEAKRQTRRLARRASLHIRAKRPTRRDTRSGRAEVSRLGVHRAEPPRTQPGAEATLAQLLHKCEDRCIGQFRPSWRIGPKSSTDAFTVEDQARLPPRTWNVDRGRLPHTPLRARICPHVSRAQRLKPSAHAPPTLQYFGPHTGLSQKGVCQISLRAAMQEEYTATRARAQKLG
jgi:hypothetical protein